MKINQILQEMRDELREAIIASGYAKTKELEAAQKLGAGEYIKKPYTLEKFGVAAVTIDEIINEIVSQNRGKGGKLRPIDSLVSELTYHRRQKETIGANRII